VSAEAQTVVLQDDFLTGINESWSFSEYYTPYNNGTNYGWESGNVYAGPRVLAQERRLVGGTCHH